MTGIEFKGWEIKLSELESMIALCKTTQTESLVFGVACMERDEVKDFIDPSGGVYKYGEYRLFTKGAIIPPTGKLLASPLTPAITYFDEFPPIPPEPFKDLP
jgi:hypothetical protein